MTVVAVIGAGAAGLVASRHLVRCGLQPCIFESASQLHGLGGAWNTANDSAKMWDNLTPNLSKYTCCFSEAPWPQDSPAFGTRQGMQHYLEQYANTFVDPQCFRFGCTVTNVRWSSSTATFNNEVEKSFQQRYQVEWAEQDGAFRSEEFDGVIVATGFFSTPVMPKGLLPMSMDQHEAAAPPETSKIIHSSAYKSPSDFCNQTVAVCGASFSALEIAADVRKQANKVISIVPSIPWVLPRYVQIQKETTDESATTNSDKFVPWDTVLYRRNRDAPQTPAALTMDKTLCQQKHELLQKLSGSRKQAQSPLGIPTDTCSPPRVAISDDYLNLAIDGNIHVVHGRVATATETNDDTLNIKLEDDKVLNGIDRIIFCTGYRSQLNFLEPDILNTLEYDEMDGYAPLSLCYDAFHPKLPGLGFVGMYKGPYFGVMELQARLLAGMLSGKVTPSQDDMNSALHDSQSIRQNSERRAQFPRFDYIGMMDSLAEQVDLVPSKEFGAKGMMASPVFYQPSKEVARQYKKELETELEIGTQETDGGTTCANVAKIALSALVGKWNFERTITQFSSLDPPQRVTGQISFSLMQPPISEKKQQGQEWNTVLYHEDGIFLLPGGKEIEVFREYEYEYKDDGILEIYFVEFGKRAHLFLSLKFSKKENGYWVATNDHLCIKDLYKATFKIRFGGIGASEISMIYRVKGPSKDYESVTHCKYSTAS